MGTRSRWGRRSCGSRPPDLPQSLLTILKLAFLALLWLFFLRVLRAAWAELKEPAAVMAAPATAQRGGAAAPSRPTTRAAPAGAAAPQIVAPAPDAGRPVPPRGQATP